MSEFKKIIATRADERITKSAKDCTDDELTTAWALNADDPKAQAAITAESRKRAAAKAAAAPPMPQETPEQIAKAAAESAIAKAQNAYDTFIAKQSEVLGLDRVATTGVLVKLNDADWNAHANAITVAKRAAYELPVELAAAPFAKMSDKIKADLDECVERFSVEQNLDETAAKKRLSEISPSYRKKYENWVQVNADKGAAVTKAMLDRDMAHRPPSVEQPAQIDKRVTAEKFLDDRATTIAKQRGITKEAAVAWGMYHDEEIQTWYAKAKAERNTARMTEGLA